MKQFGKFFDQDDLDIRLKNKVDVEMLNQVSMDRASIKELNGVKEAV